MYYLNNIKNSLNISEKKIGNMHTDFVIFCQKYPTQQCKNWHQTQIHDVKLKTKWKHNYEL